MGTFRGVFGIFNARISPLELPRSAPLLPHPTPSTRREPARKKAVTAVQEQGVEAMITAADFSLILAGNAGQVLAILLEDCAKLLLCS